MNPLPDDIRQLLSGLTPDESPNSLSESSSCEEVQRFLENTRQRDREAASEFYQLTRPLVDQCCYAFDHPVKSLLASAIRARVESRHEQLAPWVIDFSHHPQDEFEATIYDLNAARRGSKISDIAAVTDLIRRIDSIDVESSEGIDGHAAYRVVLRGLLSDLNLSVEDVSSAEFIVLRVDSAETSLYQIYGAAANSEKILSAQADAKWQAVRAQMIEAWSINDGFAACEHLPIPKGLPNPERNEEAFNRWLKKSQDFSAESSSDDQMNENEDEWTEAVESYFNTTREVLGEEWVHLLEAERNGNLATINLLREKYEHLLRHGSHPSVRALALCCNLNSPYSIAASLLQAREHCNEDELLESIGDASCSSVSSEPALMRLAVQLQRVISIDRVEEEIRGWCSTLPLEISALDFTTQNKLQPQPLEALILLHGLVWRADEIVLAVTRVLFHFTPGGWRLHDMQIDALDRN